MKKMIEHFRQYTVLYVEDNLEISEEVAFLLAAKVGTLYTAIDGQEGLGLFTAKRPDIVITDIQMPQMNGLEMIKEIRKIDAEVPIIITTAYNEADYLLKAIDLQVEGYLMKPLDMKELIARLAKIIEPLQLRRELLEKNKELETINADLDKIAKEKTKELEYLYNHDPLTGLSNFLMLGQEVETGSYHHLVLLDISNFALINKQYGKDFANTILKASSGALRDHMTEHTRLFKTESDRFVYLLKEKKKEKVEEFCRQIISFFDMRPLEIGDLEINIGFSMGIAQIVGDAYPMVDAEYALETGKGVGSRYYYYYDGSRMQKRSDTIKWLEITRKMVEEDKVEPYYQPIFDLSSGKVIKYEVLARGEHDGKVLFPSDFIEPAERLGLIGSITRMMINKSFAYFGGGGLALSLNLTLRDLLDPDLLDFLKMKSEEFAIDPKDVTFEILESVTIGAHHEAVIERIKMLRRMGFEIAIDDFGIENSNFGRLLEIEFDYIKLDGLFVKGLMEDKKERSIVAAIVSLARSLGIKTIAEFVEDESLFDVVKMSGIDMVQGHYTGGPDPTVYRDLVISEANKEEL